MTAKSQTRKRCENPKDILRKELINLISKDFSEDYVVPNDIPTKWEKHGDLILLPSYSFQDPIWSNFGTILLHYCLFYYNFCMLLLIYYSSRRTPCQNFC